MDVVQRLEPVVIEIERERECVCVVGHQAILRALYGYFTKTPLAVRAGSWLARWTALRCDPCAPTREATKWFAGPFCAPWMAGPP